MEANTEVLDLLEDLANANQLSSAWPRGKYAIPKTAKGCPRGWSTGSRYQDNEDTRSAPIPTSTGISTRMDVWVVRNLRMHYCVKTSIGSTSTTWPAGKYCIARKGGSCPTGFSSGSVYWDDEDTQNVNSFSGTLPDGDYNKNTRIYFCCRSDGSTSTAITLPTTTNFYLYRYGSTCQQVTGMSVYSDYIKTIDEDYRNTNSCSGSHPAGTCGSDIRINYCYYYKYY